MRQRAETDVSSGENVEIGHPTSLCVGLSMHVCAHVCGCACMHVQLNSSITVQKGDLISQLVASKREKNLLGEVYLSPKNVKNEFKGPTKIAASPHLKGKLP